MKQLLQLIFLLTALLANSSCGTDTLKSDSSIGKITISELYQMKPSFKSKQKAYKYSGTVEWKTGYTLRCFIGVWCHDTKREMPRLLKVLNDANVPEESIEVFLLSKTN